MPNAPSADIGSLMANARISLNEDEKKQMQKEIIEILEFFSKISEVDVSETPPGFQPIEISNVLRDDIPAESLPQDDALKNCANTKDGFIKGPCIG